MLEAAANTAAFESPASSSEAASRQRIALSDRRRRPPKRANPLSMVYVEEIGAHAGALRRRCAPIEQVSFNTVPSRRKFLAVVDIAYRPFEGEPALP